MTSKISFLKLMQEDAKRRNWMLVFLSVLFFVCYPVLMMIGLDAQTTVNSEWIYDRIFDVCRDFSGV